VLFALTTWFCTNKELLELEERLGEVKKKGASKDTIAAHTQTYTFHSSSSSNKEALR